jgi:hypothetical protein
VPRPLIARPGQKPKTNDFDTLSSEQGLSPRDLHGRLFVDKSLAHILLFAVLALPSDPGELMFTKTTYLVREHVGLLKFANTYDILEADSGRLVAVAQEKPGLLVHLLRFVLNKQMLPTHVFIAPSADDAPVISIHRGVTLISAKIAVKRGDGSDLGYFKSKMFSLGGGFPRVQSRRCASR